MSAPLQRGQEAMTAGRYDEAARAFHEAVQAAPTSDEPYFLMASALCWRGLPTEALPALDRCAAMGGAFALPAGELATRIRRQLSLPMHGLMIMPGGPAAASSPARSPATTLTGMPAGSFASGRVTVPTRVLETAVLRFLARVVHADGVVHPLELALLRRSAIELGLGVAEADRILDDELARRSDPASLARQIPQAAHRRRVLSLGCAMAMAEGSVADAERAILDGFARGAEIPADEAARILAQTVAAKGPT